MRRVERGGGTIVTENPRHFRPLAGSRTRVLTSAEMASELPRRRR